MARIPLVAAALIVLHLAFGSHTATAAPPEQQAEKALLPFLDLLASPPAGEARACRVLCRVESLGEVQFSPESSPTLEFAIQPPGRLLLKMQNGSTEFTACRDGQKAWVAPAALLENILRGEAPSKDKEFSPLQLPLSGKQLSILPVLLEVQDKGSLPLDGTSCRVLDVRLRPEIGGLLPAEASQWSVRLWLDALGKPVRAGVRLPKTSLVFRVDKIDFSKDLPPALWSTPTDARKVTPGDFEKAATRLLQGMK